MTHDDRKPVNVYEQLRLIRMTAARRRNAIANLKRGEAIADVIVGAVRLVRRAAAGISRAVPLGTRRVKSAAPGTLLRGLLGAAGNPRNPWRYPLH
jgi:hypothetical protein